MVSRFKKRKKRWIRILAMAGLFVLAVGVFAPWPGLLAYGLKKGLEAQGFAPVRLTLAQAGLARMTLGDVSLGGSFPLTFKEITLDDPQGNWLTGSARRLTLAGLDLDVRQDGAAWHLNGSEPQGSGAPLVLPVEPEDVAGVFLENAEVKDSRVRFTSKEGTLEIPFHLTWQKRPQPKVACDVSGIAFKAQGMAMTAGAGRANVLLATAGKWAGTWELDDIRISGAAVPIPVLKGAGTIFLYADRAEFQGQFRDAAETVRLSFDLKKDFVTPGASVLTITQGHFPWLDGKLSVQDVKVSLAEKKAIPVDLKIEGVSAQSLMKELTGERASATGKLSGTLPVTLLPEGDLVFRQGVLQADQPGTLTLSPEVIPGDNPQVSFVRDVLQDFHYTTLSLRLNSGKDKGLEMQMTLEGNNPKVQNGRAVKVNVNLKGDVLDFVKQNLIWLTDPQKMMEQGTNAQP